MNPPTSVEVKDMTADQIDAFFEELEAKYAVPFTAGDEITRITAIQAQGIILGGFRGSIQAYRQDYPAALPALRALQLENESIPF